MGLCCPTSAVARLRASSQRRDRRHRDHDGEIRQDSQMHTVLRGQRTCTATTRRLGGCGSGAQGETRERARVCSPLPLPMRLSRYRVCRARACLVQTGTATDHRASRLGPQPAGSLSLDVVPTDAQRRGGSDQAATKPGADARSSQRGPLRCDPVSQEWTSEHTSKGHWWSGVLGVASANQQLGLTS